MLYHLTPALLIGTLLLTLGCDPSGTGYDTPTADPSATQVQETPTEGPSPTPTLPLIDADQDGITTEEGDCDDRDPDVYPEAPEYCDGIDQDCDEAIDEGSLDQRPFYIDGDGDGVGTQGEPVIACDPPEGYAPGNGDCDDEDPDTYPEASEICDFLDNDCDERFDEGLSSDLYFLDTDGDGFGVGEGELTCEPEEGAALVDGDCDDTNPEVYPEAEELCDGLDGDCDELIDEGVGEIAYPDPDNDGFGAPIDTLICGLEAGFVDNNEDCDSASPHTHPGAPELADGRDNDCDEAVDEGIQNLGVGHRLFYHRDADGDGFGSLSDVRLDPASGYIPVRGDCDDADPDIHPGASDTSGDGIDSDCGGQDAPAPHLGFGAFSAPSLSLAFSVAEDLSTIWVGPGTYRAKGLAFPANRAIKLRSTHYAEETTLLPEGENYILSLTNQGVETTLDGFTLAEGRGKLSGALVISGGDGPSVTNLWIKENRSTVGSGGGMTASPSSLRMAYLTIEDNIAAGNGGGATFSASGGYVSRVIVRDNSTSGVASNGGGLFLQGRDYALEWVTIEDNESNRGGGVYGGSIAQVSFKNIIVGANLALESGGGLYLAGAKVDMLYVDIQNNEGGIAGGGMYISGSSIDSSYDHMIVAGNGADEGGGIYLGAPDAAITQSVITHNDAVTGGGLFVITRGGSGPGPTLRGVALGDNNGGEIAIQGEDDSGFDIQYSAITGGSSETPFDELDPTVVTTPLGLLGGEGWLDGHLTSTSSLIDAGPPDAGDLDGSDGDIGAYGGPLGGGWDRDGDGTPDYAWAGTYSQRPGGIQGTFEDE